MADELAIIRRTTVVDNPATILTHMVCLKGTFYCPVYYFHPGKAAPVQGMGEYVGVVLTTRFCEMMGYKSVSKYTRRLWNLRGGGVQTVRFKCRNPSNNASRLNTWTTVTLQDWVLLLLSVQIQAQKQRRHVIWQLQQAVFRNLWDGELNFKEKTVTYVGTDIEHRSLQTPLVTKKHTGVYPVALLTPEYIEPALVTAMPAQEPAPGLAVRSVDKQPDGSVALDAVSDEDGGAEEEENKQVEDEEEGKGEPKKKKKSKKKKKRKRGEEENGPPRRLAGGVNISRMSFVEIDDSGQTTPMVNLNTARIAWDSKVRAEYLRCLPVCEAQLRLKHLESRLSAVVAFCRNSLSESAFQHMSSEILSGVDVTTLFGPASSSSASSAPVAAVAIVPSSLSSAGPHSKKQRVEEDTGHAMDVVVSDGDQLQGEEEEEEGEEEEEEEEEEEDPATTATATAAGTELPSFEHMPHEDAVRMAEIFAAKNALAHT